MDRLRDRPIELDSLSVEFHTDDDLRAWRSIVRIVRGRLPQKLPKSIDFMVYADRRAMHVDVEATRTAGKHVAWDLYMHRQESVSGPDPLSKKIGWTLGLGRWMEGIYARALPTKLDCTATYECDSRRSKSNVVLPDRVPRELAPPHGLDRARVYSLGIEQDGQRLSFEIDRTEETLWLGVAFQFDSKNLESLLEAVETEAWSRARSWVMEVPSGADAEAR